MPKIRIKQAGDATKIFCPFPRVNSTVHIISSIGWNNIDGPSEVFCLDDSDTASQLASLKGERDMLYIRGHCAAGSLVLQSSDHQQKITAAELRNTLFGKLDLDFPGIIKIYACQSSKPDSSFWERFAPFAQQFADEMWATGYKKCSFYGYDTAVTTHPMGEKNHKWSVEEDWTMNHRASVVRVQIIPTQMPQSTTIEPTRESDKNYSLVLSGETYSLLEVPAESSQAVVAGKKAILESLRLENLVTGLSRAADLVYVAQNGVAGFGPLMAAMTGLSDSIIAAASDTALTLSSIADDSDSILRYLQRSMGFLVSGREKLAVKYLAKCAVSAQEISTDSSQLAATFDRISDQAIEILQDTQIEQGRQHEKIAEERRNLAQLKANNAAARALNQELATQRVSLKVLYEEAKAQQQTSENRAFAMRITGAITGAIGAGLDAFAQGMIMSGAAKNPKGAIATIVAKQGEDVAEHISESSDVIATSQTEVAQAYRQEKAKYLDILLKAEENQRQVLADIARYAELLKSAVEEDQIAEVITAALHSAVGALKGIATTLRDNAYFWQLMANACQKLAEPDFLELMGDIEELSLDERLAIYFEDDFKLEIITYYAQWQAMSLVCNEYGYVIFEARAKMLEDFLKNPTIEEARRLAPVLAEQLLEDVQANTQELDR